MSRPAMELGFATDTGRVRERNEDSFAIFAPYPGEPNVSGLEGLLLVADGMGGASGGQQASGLAAQRMRQWFASGEFRSWSVEAPEAGLLQAALTRAFHTVSDEVRDMAEADPSLRGAGSTLVMALVEGRKLVVAHVGDSRCYRVRDGRIERLTVDHSWVQKQVDSGVISLEEARNHPQRNVLTRSLGDRLSPKPDVRTEEMREDDVFILCTDGLFGKVRDEEILELARRPLAPQALAEALVSLGVERDGTDNVTVVVGAYAAKRPAAAAPPPTVKEIPAPRVWPWLLTVVAALGVGFAAGFFTARGGALLPKVAAVEPTPAPEPTPIPTPAPTEKPAPTPAIAPSISERRNPPLAHASKTPKPTRRTDR